MIEWFGGTAQVFQILLPLFGLCVVLIAPKITDTNRARRYVAPAFGCWLALQLLIGLEEGTLVSFPDPFGFLVAVLLLLGFVVLMFRGLFAAWKTREASESPT